MLSQHYPNDLLLSFLDGEASARERNAIAIHLRSCSECKKRLASLEFQLKELTYFVRQESPAASASMSRMRARLHEGMQAAERERWLRINCRATFERLHVPALAAAVLLVIAAGAVSWMSSSHSQAHKPDWQTLPPNQVRAMSTLVRASASALSDKSSHQEFRLQARQVSPAPSQHAETLIVWSAPQQGKYASRLISGGGRLDYAVWRDGATSRYAFDSSAGPTVQLSPAPRYGAQTSLLDLADRAAQAGTFERLLLSWMEAKQWQPLALASDVLTLASADGYGASVERKQSSSAQIQLLVHIRRGATMLTAELWLTNRDGRQWPQLQRLRVESRDYIYEVVLESEAIDMPLGARLQEAFFEPDRTLMTGRSLPGGRTAAAPKSPSKIVLIQLEVEVLYALHRAGACLGEPIEVSINGPAVVVQGRAASAARKEAVLRALAPLRQSYLRVDLLTDEEALQGQTALPEGERKIRSYGVVKPDSYPMKNRLREYAAGQTANRKIGVEQVVAELTDRIYSESREALSEAWSLRRLASRFPAALAADLAPEPRRLLQLMLQEHLSGLRAKTSALREHLQPLLDRPLPPSQPPAPAETDAESLFESVERLTDQVNLLFAGSANEAADAAAGASIDTLRDRLIAEAAAETAVDFRRLPQAARLH